MNVEVRLINDHHFVGKDSRHMETVFDSRTDGTMPVGTSPTSAMLQALCACTGIDVVDILKKKRLSVQGLVISAKATNAEEHPRVFVTAHLHFVLQSPDATKVDLDRCIQLSQERYCSISAMFRQSGCLVTTSSEIVSSDA